ncbi:DUF3152 domain-containing protein [Streptomyces sp. NPDC006552]|uniref:DUF3152 domain-containing protein n=1 Tax=Streptomyces sp. NPDC006552 TaxID=3157179 RepID=UPI0033B37C5D
MNRGRRRQGARRAGKARRRLTHLLLPCAVLAAVLCASGGAYAYWQHTRELAVARCVRAGERPGDGAGGALTGAAPGVLPVVGPGTFAVARGGGAVAGTGHRLRRYKVLVEDGIGIRADDAAREIAGILGDPRGWSHDGADSFQLVGSGPRDFVVKIATPHTVDCLCGSAGLDTGGEVNCSVGQSVVVNLRRWVAGSPEFDGPIGEYRALIVNHEVGHRIGHGHETCPGAGRPAPAMMQQIKGLHGCTANAWPYDRAGSYLGGPHVA